MNFIQIKYFVTAARCQNFTKAADQLYITQPALSRQILSMEKELNLQLFIRTGRNVRLTPAGRILLEKFQVIYDAYQEAVFQAKQSFKGLSGTINIGILDGAGVGDLFPETLRHFAAHYPNVEIALRNYSFNGLIQRLYDNELDLIITLKFDVAYRENICYRVIEKTRDHVVVHKNHPMAEKNFVTLEDFEKDVFIMVSEEDSEMSPRLIKEALYKAGVHPNIRYASSIQEEMLWVEAGVGVCILDSRNILRNNPSVRFLNTDFISDPSLSLAWHRDNDNPLRGIFTEIFFADKKNSKQFSYAELLPAKIH